MVLNVSKCKIISLSRKQSRNKILFNYNISNEELKRCFVVYDLGVHIDEKVNMNEHISITTTRACLTLRFVKRLFKEFDNPYVTKKFILCISEAYP